MDPALWDTMRWDYFRWDVYLPNWDRVVQRIESVGGVSTDVTRRALELGARNATTGWRDKDFTESTINGFLIPRSSGQIASAVGAYVRTDDLFITADGLFTDEEVLDAHGKYWRVVAVRDVSFGDSFSHRLCDLVLLPTHFT